MLKILPELIMGPLLVGGSTLVGERWGTRVGGLVSAFPAVVGPVLLITAQARGAAAAARAAQGTLLGLVALSAFVVTYAWIARHSRWRTSLVAGWAAAGLMAAAVGGIFGRAGLPVALASAVISLLLARLAMPRTAAGPGPDRAERANIPARMGVTALLVASLATAAAVLGPLVGGMLSGLPILASVLAVFTHRREGGLAVIALLRGMLVGMAGFVGFCAVVASLITLAGTEAAFAAGAFVAVALQALVVLGGLRRAPVRLRS